MYKGYEEPEPQTLPQAPSSASPGMLMVPWPCPWDRPPIIDLIEDEERARRQTPSLVEKRPSIPVCKDH
jgi:hypothetical protein